MKAAITTRVVAHPLEEVFNIDEGSTELSTTVLVPEDGDTAESPAYDDKDNEIESRLETIYTTALSGAIALSDQIDLVEGKYKPRVGETSAAMLNVALGAVREKAALKMHKDKMLGPKSSRKGAPGDGDTYNTQNNIIVADRNEVLRMLKGAKPE